MLIFWSGELIIKTNVYAKHLIKKILDYFLK